MLRVGHLVRHLLLEIAQFGALCDCMRHGKLDHMIPASQGYHIVEDSRSGYFRRVLKMELLGFKVPFVLGCNNEIVEWRGCRRESQVGQDILLLANGEVPKNGYAVSKYEHLGKSIRVGCYAVWRA